MPLSAYHRAAARFARIATLREAGSMLGWDAATMMPPGGAAARGDQLAVLAGVAHEMLTDPDLAEDLAAADAADAWQTANLRLMRRAVLRATALPEDLVEASSRANAACETIWREARARADFAAVEPALIEVVNLTRQAAEALAPVLGLSPYDCLMDGWQPGIGAADVAPIFSQYEAFLREALPVAQARQAAALRPAGPFPADVQEALCRRLSQAAGLDYTHARLDRSAHPFCGGIPTDIRITTRYDEADFAGSLMGVLHETGHALYERGLPAAFARQKVGEAAGMAVHESQSLIIEMQACRSDAYLEWLGPHLLEAFGGDRAVYATGNLVRLWRHVAPGFIRVDADEMTYPAHIFLRLQLEQALIGGDLRVADLPGAWNAGMQSMLGITPPDDAAGCLQDIHWYDGLFGYFPSYTLGAMAAAQLMAAARRAVPDLDASLRVGDLSPLTAWLRENIHSQGARLGFNALLTHATGKPLDPSDFVEHLTRRYLA
jgi:carboxypeptidase Taq